MSNFFRENSYSMVRLFLNQIALTVFGTMLALATAKNDTLLIVTSIFSVLFYLYLVYSFGWEITYEASTTSFVPGTAEFIQEELTGLLSQIATEDGYQSPEKAQDYYQAPFEPKSDGNVYINPAPGVTDNYKAAKNDFFAFQMLFNGKVKNFLCKDEALVKQILAMNEAKFLVDEQNVVVGLAD